MDAEHVSAPILKDSPVALECKVKDVIPLGTHDMFLAEIVGVDVDESLLDKDGRLCLDRVKLTSYAHGEYFALGKKLGSFGYSVRKKKNLKKRKTLPFKQIKKHQNHVPDLII